MIKIAHRINTKEQLALIPKEFGIEIDLRYDVNDIILHHDPFVEGEYFENLLVNFNHRFLILNVKSEGIEERIIELLNKYKIENFFFLDLSLPYLIKYMNKGLSRIAVRFSEYEPIEFVMAFKNKVEWVWIDCFNNLPLNQSNYDLLKQNFKICLVSPELQGHDLNRIEEFKIQLKDMKIDAVCTKRPDLW